MKRFFATTALLTGLLISANAQTSVTQTAAPSPEMMKLDSLTKLSQRFLNEQKVDSLYALMGTAFKGQLSLDKMKEVATQLNGQLGKWVSDRKSVV